MLLVSLVLLVFAANVEGVAMWWVGGVVALEWAPATVGAVALESRVSVGRHTSVEGACERGARRRCWPWAGKSNQSDQGVRYSTATLQPRPVDAAVL